MKKYQLYINGNWLDTKEVISSIDPSTEEVIAEIPKADNNLVKQAISFARTTFDKGDWSNLAFSERAEYLKKISEGILENAQKLAELEARDTGKTIKQTTFIDVPTAAECFDYFSKVESELKGEQVSVPFGGQSTVVREPLGVIASITPWNYPLIMAAWKIAPALACGNTIVFKPSQLASLTSLELAKIIDKAGLPKGVFNIVTGSGAEIGKELAQNTSVDMVAFTGSTEVGKEVMSLASNNVKKVFLELGGKSPNIVFDDCDLEAAVGGTMSAIFMNQGQMCVAGSRLLLQDTIYDKFIELLIEKTKKLKLGPALDYSSDIGPLVSKQQRQRVLDYIEIGKKEARLLCGGNIPKDFNKGYFLAPTIFDNVKNNMRIAREEIFGPVLSIIKFSSEDEAIEIANDTIYGLAAMIWTKDLLRANIVSKKLRSGTVWVNTYGMFFNQTPFGGYKQSGIGRELGRDGLLEYTQTKHINIDLTSGGKSLVSSWFGG
ncbi:MAG: aldehyde dehydrogenase family protein [Candidatus Omnitrophota bacterium]